MHVRKVPLLHALEVLAANTGASWASYFAAPDKTAIDTALATMATGQEWKAGSIGHANARPLIWTPAQ
jgi:hypothetical protein